MKDMFQRREIALNPSDPWLVEEREVLLAKADDPKASVSLLTSPQEPPARPKKFTPRPQNGRKFPPCF